MKCRSDDVPARILAAAGLLREDGDGFSPAAGMTALMEHGGPALVESMRSAVGRIATVVRGGSLQEGWATEDDETLVAQGAASGGLVSVVLPAVFGQLPELEEQVHAAGACFLDVGVGVAGMACALAEAFPSLSIVGIDPLPRAIRLASQAVAARDLGQRVALRACGVQDIDDQDAFDVAWIPAPFVPPPDFEAGLANLHRALRPGGWILVGMGRLDGRGVPAEVTRWQTTLAGGTPLTPDEAATLLTNAGFTDIVRVTTPPTTPVLVAARRTARSG